MSLDKEIDYSEFGYEYQVVQVENLHDSDVLIGECGGLSAVFKIYDSVFQSCSEIQTEHGSLHLHKSSKVVIIKRLENDVLGNSTVGIY
jgi:hypothetical protein